MWTYVSEQTYVFLVTLYGGIIIGFIYDLYRIFRLIFSPKKIATMVEDFIFWILISIIATLVLVFGNEGQIRFYTIGGFFVGALSYNLLLSKIIITFIVRTLVKVKKIIIKIIINPIKKLFHMGKIPLRKIQKITKPHMRKLKRIKKIPNRVIKDTRKYLKYIKDKK
ncbi:MAG: spore cortex biosynthesis protein YabQ [Anaeromicrobium sp.]|jgi:spore cortex biosynthesis protein YabQ|uniref:spore cortex biosynthesis protein YabQ n=1 Tax=Anaeromicrobium sp. TaxID=1929132 RepID=UPI0025F6D639|nr:spore cortex biosynthesis protein YabQ [Anaeromicrobium sp.]MCT4594051.1 spore cortex biosynthesis protein YabQ [Anaeromicrobium sp.]